MLVSEWHSASLNAATGQGLAACVTAILTPPVTQSLPEEWRGEYTVDRASRWIEERDRDGVTLLVTDRSSNQAIGLLILFESDDAKIGRSVRIGYLLSESVWGQGLASELVQGFVDWCSETEISLIIAGVERGNSASRRVLEKSGFKAVPDAPSSETLIYQVRL